jgi:hypothetical protein
MVEHYTLKSYSLLFCFAVSSRLNIPPTVANLEDISKVLLANICIDQTGQPRSAPLLLRYQPLVKNFLDGSTVLSAQEMPIELSALFVAQPVSAVPPVDHPDLIPTGKVSEMASPVDIFEVIGKKSKEASSSKSKGKAKQGVQPKRSRRAIFEAITPEQPKLGEELSSAPTAEQSGLPQIVEDVEAEQVEELAPRSKRARVTTEQTELPGPSSSDEIWAPEMTVAGDPVTTNHTVLDTSDVEFSARVAQALTRATCLPGDYQVWEDMSSGQMFRHISRGLVMVRYLNKFF